VAWRGETPVVVAGNQVVLAGAVPEVLVRAPADATALAIAADMVDLPPRSPGPPESGPLWYRYRPIVMGPRTGRLDQSDNRLRQAVAPTPVALTRLTP
jgi:hypothetical protein